MKYQFFQDLNQDIINIRKIVFQKEQGFQEEFDDIDHRSIHLVVYQNHKAVGTGRTFWKENGVYAIGRIAILKEYRGCNLGAEILRLLEEKVRELGGRKIVLSAQCRVQGFYEKQGYKPSGNIYMDEHCEHIWMEKEFL